MFGHAQLEVYHMARSDEDVQQSVVFDNYKLSSLANYRRYQQAQLLRGKLKSRPIPWINHGFCCGGRKNLLCASQPIGGKCIKCGAKILAIRFLHCDRIGETPEETESVSGRRPSVEV